MVTTVMLMVAVSVGSATDQSTLATSIDTARDLYAAASYREALDTLSKADSAETPPPSFYEYQGLCLFALGRKEEAAAAFTRLVERDPLFQIDLEALAPSVRALLESVRQEILPKAARQRFTGAREAFERGNYQAASAGFADVGRILDQVAALGTASDDTKDLATLARGFADLVEARMRPMVSHPASSVAPVGAPSIGRARAPLVVAAVPVSRSVPAWPAKLPRPLRHAATMEIIIDATGTVTSARMNESVNPTYDSMLVAAVMAWRYEPATRDGHAIESTQSLRIELPR